MSSLLSLFSDVTYQGVPLVLVIIGTTQFASSVKFNGKSLSPDASRVVAYALGLLFGVGFEVAAHGVPADFMSGFGFALYGLVAGLVSTNLYDVATNSPKPS